jgi:hypothetical protein
LAWGQTWPWLDQFRFPDRRVFQPVGLRVALPEPGISVEVVRDAVRHLCDRHESLRTRYAVAVDGAPVQHVSDESALDLEVVRLPADTSDQTRERRVSEVIRDAYRPFDITRSCGRGLLVARGDAVIEILFLLHTSPRTCGAEPCSGATCWRISAFQPTQPPAPAPAPATASVSVAVGSTRRGSRGSGQQRKRHRRRLTATGPPGISGPRR